MACPVCQCDHFYVKDPTDEFEIYEFTLKNGRIQYEDDSAAAKAPDKDETPEIFCQRCTWHGKISKIA